MKNILVLDWEGENPYYSEVDRNKVNLVFCESLSNLLSIEKSKISGGISHYGLPKLMIEFSDEIKGGIFPIIAYRISENEIKSSIQSFEKLNLPLNDFYNINTQEGLGNLVKKLFY